MLDAGADDLGEISPGVQRQRDDAGEEAVKANEAEDLEFREVHAVEDDVVDDEKLYEHRRCTEDLDVDVREEAHGVEAREGVKKSAASRKVALRLRGEAAENVQLAQTRHGEQQRQNEAEQDRQRRERDGADEPLFKELDVFEGFGKARGADHGRMPSLSL